MSLYDSRIEAKAYKQLVGDNLQRLARKALEVKEPIVKRFLIEDVGGWIPIITPIVEIPAVPMPRKAKKGQAGKGIDRTRDRAYRRSLESAHDELLRCDSNFLKGGKH